MKVWKTSLLAFGAMGWPWAEALLPQQKVSISKGTSISTLERPRGLPVVLRSSNNDDDNDDEMEEKNNGNQGSFLGEAFSIETVASLTVPQLKEELRLRGLQVTGIKQELIDRLVTATSSAEGDEFLSSSEDNLEEAIPETTPQAVDPTEVAVLEKEVESTVAADNLRIQKQKLFEILGAQSRFEDPVLADPITKEPIAIEAPGVLLGGQQGRPSVSYRISSSSNTFGGSSSTFLNLLEPITTESGNEEGSPTSMGEKDPSTVAADLAGRILQQAMPYVPPPLRAPLASLAGDDSYIPMRDLFTSPAVSYAYERGWRQGFATAGFPGPDVEAEMAMEYFAPVVARADSSSVVVDMSCATGLFTRRFASTDKYARVLGCDYSEAMLTEARRRIDAEPKLRSLKKTNLEDRKSVV